MNTKFVNGEFVEALDTITGVWRDARITNVMHASVTTKFNSFGPHKYPMLTETVTGSAVYDESEWPIRKRLSPRHETRQQSKRRRFTKDGNPILSSGGEALVQGTTFGYSDTALGYAPRTLITLANVSFFFR